MSEGCTNCGNKGGCDHRKGEMFSAIDAVLLSLYPSRQWGPRNESEAAHVAYDATLSDVLAAELRKALGTWALARAGTDEEWCDYVYALCFGRAPSILEAREGHSSAGRVWSESGLTDGVLEERHLRVALSTLAPFGAVQEVTLTLQQAGDAFLISEIPRTGVFDPVLLPRYRRLVTTLAGLGIRNLDFGDLTNPPDGYDGGAYRALFASEPCTVNYLFFPQPAAAITSTWIEANVGQTRFL